LLGLRLLFSVWFLKEEEVGLVMYLVFV